MKKEIVISIVIIIFIVIGDILLQKYTENSFDLIEDKLSTIKDNLEDKEKSLSQIDVVNEEWNKRFNILTCFLEHDELEKIKTQLVVIKSGVQVNDAEYAYEEIDKALYILNHLKDKQSLKWDNLF